MTAWELFRSSPDVAYLDIDQVGMLYPDQESDGGGHLLQQHALAALRPNYGDTGHLLVSGVVDPVLAADPAAPVPRADVHYCLLTADPGTVRARVRARGWAAEDADEAVAEQDALVAAGFADAVVDTTGLSPGEVAGRVAAGITPPGRPRAGAGSAPGDGPLPTASVLLTGPRAVGCSTVGFALARGSWDEGVRTGFADVGQLSFRRGPGSDADTDPVLGLANLATLREVFARQGAGRFVANGHLGHRPPPAATVVVRLRASETSLRAHVRSRHDGNEARLAGDDLAAATPAYRESVVRAALADQEHLEQAPDPDLVVDVSDRTVDDVVEEVAAHLGWSLRR